MNWKIVVGIAIGIALIAMGIMAVHSGAVKKVAGTNLLDDGVSGGTEGPHPPSADGWQVIGTEDGPHPPSADGWQ